MSASRSELALWSLAALLVVGAAAEWQLMRAHAVIAARSAVESRAATALASGGFATADSLAAWMRAAVDRDPFRLLRHPSPIAYQAVFDGVPASPAPPKPSHPALALAGIVGGPPWAALVEGIPGREGATVVRAGDTLGGLRIRAVGRDTVIVRGADTTWKLVLKRPW